MDIGGFFSYLSIVVCEYGILVVMVIYIVIWIIKSG